MTRVRGSFALALALAACARPSLPPPVAPLVPTPDAAFRRTAPQLPPPGPIPAPAFASQRLGNGITLLTAVIPDSPYTELRLLTRHALDETEAELWAGAIYLASQADVTRLPMERAGATRSAIALGWRCEPERLNDALAAARIVLSSPPAQADVEQARRSRALRKKRQRMSLTAALGTELRVRLLGAGPKPKRARMPGSEEGAAGRTAGADELLLFDPNQVALVVAGAVDPSAVATLAESSLGGIAPRASPRAESDPGLDTRSPPLASKPIVLVPRSVRLAVVGFGFVAPPLNQADSADAGLIADMLAGSSSALLNTSLREQSGLTYSVSAAYEADGRGGLLVGYLAVEEARVPQAIQALRAGFEQLRTVPQPELFALARQRELGALAWNLRRAETAAALLERAFIERLSPDIEQGLVARLEAIDAPAIQRSAQALLAKPLLVVVGSPEVGTALERAHEDFEVAQ